MIGIVGSAPQRRERLDRSGRLLRVAYISADFRNHPIAFFIESLLAHHDPERVEVICYSDVLNPDAFTRRLQSHVGNWRQTGGLSSAELESQIRDDHIDVLIDLSDKTVHVITGPV